MGSNPEQNMPRGKSGRTATWTALPGPVNTYVAARDGDGFRPAQGTNRAAEQASVSGEQRRAGRNPSRPFGLRAKNAGAASQSLPIAGYALRLTPCRAFFTQQRGCDISVSRPWISSGEEGYRVGELLFLAFLQPPPGLFFHQD